MPLTTWLEIGLITVVLLPVLALGLLWFGLIMLGVLWEALVDIGL